jgi:hypothetical protein
MYTYSFTLRFCLWIIYIIKINAVPFPPPDAISLALVNFNPKEITFSWSPVATDCPSIQYNILASNCGSCPNTTNHTTATCTDLPSDGSVCTLAVETVVCGNITGNQSKPLSFNISDTLHVTVINSRCTGATASASVFAIGLTISVIVFISVIIVLLKVNIKARRFELATRRRAQGKLSSHEEQDPGQQLRRTTIPESTVNTTIMDYEIAKVAVIATNKNIAYADTAIGQTESSVKDLEHEYAQIHQF